MDETCLLTVLQMHRRLCGSHKLPPTYSPRHTDSNLLSTWQHTNRRTHTCTCTNKPRRRIKVEPDEGMSAELWLVARVTGTRLPACRVCCSCRQCWENHTMKMMMCLGPIQRSPSKCGQRGCVLVSECVFVCGGEHINVFVRQGKSQRSGLLFSKTMISIKCRCFLQLECFHWNPSSLFL